MDAAFPFPIGHSKRPLAVLIVESDFLARWRAAEYLRERDFTVIEANDAVDAIGLLASNIPVDIVVCDSGLTDQLNQIGLTDWFEKSHPHIPLLVTYAGDLECTRIAGNAKRQFIVKPYALVDLHSHIELMLNQS